MMHFVFPVRRACPPDAAHAFNFMLENSPCPVRRQNLNQEIKEAHIIVQSKYVFFKYLKYPKDSSYQPLLPPKYLKKPLAEPKRPSTKIALMKQRQKINLSTKMPQILQLLLQKSPYQQFP